MMDFFRKNMKALLGVFMALLLVVWLGGQALTSALNRSSAPPDRVIGTIYDQPVKNSEVGWFNNNIQLLTSANLDPRQMLTRGLTEPVSEIDCFLLYREALQNQINIPAIRVDEIYKTIPAQTIDALRTRSNCSIEQIKIALRVLITMQEAFSQAASGINPTEADITDVVRQTTEKVSVRMAVFSPNDFIDESEEPSVEMIAAQFDKYKDVAPNPREQKPGYQLPESAQAEYIMIDAKVLGQSQEISDRDALAYWQANKERFNKPQPPVEPGVPPGDRPKPEPYATFTEARDDVVAAMQDAKGQELAKTIANDLISLLSTPWAKQPKSDDGFYTQIPDSAKNPDLYQELIATLETQYPGALSYERTPELDQSNLWGEGGKIGSTMSMLRTPQATRFAEAAFWVKGLSTKPEDQEKRQRFFRNLYETCSAQFVDRSGNAFVFRTTAIKPARTAESVDIVKDAVIRDIRMDLAAAKAKTQAEAFFAQAKEVGMEKAFEAIKASLPEKAANAGLRTPPPFARKTLREPNYYQRQWQLTPSFIGEVGMDEDFIELCYADPDAKGPYIQMFDQESSRKQIVVERLAFKPIERPDYVAQREKVTSYLGYENYVAFIKNWVDPDNIHKRVSWVETPRENENDDSEETPEGKATESAPAENTAK